jgi:hypothetical protein
MGHCPACGRPVTAITAAALEPTGDQITLNFFHQRSRLTSCHRELNMAEWYALALTSETPHPDGEGVMSTLILAFKCWACVWGEHWNCIYSDCICCGGHKEPTHE